MQLHVLYAGADRFVSAIVPKVGRVAREAFETHLAADSDLARVIGAEVSGVDLDELRARVRARLERAPVDDFRVDFEDGYGVRADLEEDEHARAAGRALAEGHLAGTLPPSVGIRIAPMETATRARALRTLSLVMDAMCGAYGTRPLRVTLPKVQRAREVDELAGVLEAHERERVLPEGSLTIELMLEQPAAFLDASGRVPIRALVEAGRGRVRSCHLGSYDLTAALDVPGWAQRADHPACATARMLAKLALAGTGVLLFDGATTRLPLPRSRGASADADRARDHEEIVAAMAEHAGNVRRALSEGIDAGWDLHPAQIPARLCAVFATYLAAREAMTVRLSRFLERHARATATGSAFDDAATGRALVSFFDRGHACGALDADDLARVGIERAPETWRLAAVDRT
ncbi:MAG: phosphoenolpyruvate kinase [Sandaracinaceae bacterium]|nr:phosphoenolpyruvate kinase [Sandaracinaceae bacterium]